jgi:hypothetical protein
MAVLPDSNLHLAAVTVKYRLKSCFGDGVSVTIGTPKKAEPSDEESSPVVNLFFYRFALSGFQAAAHPREPLLVRAWCLITSFSPHGEDDLKILGEIMRFLHENPELTPDSASLDKVKVPFALQAIPVVLETEELNHIWTTQGDLPYRPSMAYEFAVVPLDPYRSLEAPPNVERGEWSITPHMREKDETATVHGEVTKKVTE